MDEEKEEQVLIIEKIKKQMSKTSVVFGKNNVMLNTLFACIMNH